MNNRILVLASIVLLAILTGVVLTVYQNNSPIMQRIIAQQTETLKLQREVLALLKNIAEPGGTLTQDAGAHPGDIGNRMALMEKKLDALVNVISGVRPGAPQPAQQAPSEDYTKEYQIPREQSPLRGPQEAPVTITAFIDFQCPFSARFHPLILETLSQYPKEVNFMIKNFPLGFHQQAKPAARAVLAAGEQGKYWEMVDAILKDNSQLSEQKFADLAKEIGLNVEKFKKDLEAKASQYDQIVDKDMALVTQAEVRGTPTFFINGRRTRSRDFASLKQEIDAILQKAK
jgi:protein-disulfide isomerase